MFSFRSLKPSPGIHKKKHQRLNALVLWGLILPSLIKAWAYCVSVWVSSGDPRPPPSSFCQQCACLTMSAKGSLVSWRRVWNLDDICRAGSFSLDHHAKITRSWIHTTVSVARELSSHLVTKQQHGMKPFAALPTSCGEQRNMQPHTHTHECALCESVYTSCNRFIADTGSVECETAFCKIAVVYFYGLRGTRVEAARSSAVGYVSCFVMRWESQGGEIETSSTWAFCHAAS